MNIKGRCYLPNGLAVAQMRFAALRKAGCKKIFQEKISGTKWERPELHKMLDIVDAGDIVIVWRLDRLARSTKMLLEITDRILEVGAKFSSLSEPWASKSCGIMGRSRVTNNSAKSATNNSETYT